MKVEQQEKMEVVCLRVVMTPGAEQIYVACWNPRNCQRLCCCLLYPLPNEIVRTDAVTSMV